jgi:hypothetical protein
MREAGKRKMRAAIWYCSVTGAIASTLVSQLAAAAPEPLSVTALDQAVAGSDSASSETESARPTIVVAGGADIDLDLRRAIELHDNAERNLTALNVVNAAQSDTVNAINLLHGGEAFLARQLNAIEQTELHVGSASRIERFDANRITTSEQHSRYDSQSSTFARTEQVLRTRTSRSVVDTYNAQVPGYFPLQNLSLTIGTPALPSVTVPRFGFDLTYTDDVGGVYGIRGGLGPFYFDPPQIVLGTVSLSGDDVVLRGGFVKLPSLDLGSANIDFCFIECGGIDVDLPTINGPRIDFGGELRIPGANPFKDVRVNAGGGVSVAGAGHISVDLGHVRVGAEFSLDIPDLTTSFSFDVLGYTVNTGTFGVEIPAVTATVDLIDADIGVAYDATFNGVLCISIVTTTCQASTHRETNESVHIDVTRTSATASNSASGGDTSHGNESITIGARMTGAEADLIAMSEGNANIDTTSLVQLDSQAQRGMSVVNAVNATGAMVGNAMNTATQRSAVQSSGQLSGSIGQSNVFTQYQTRPRTP